MNYFMILDIVVLVFLAIGLVAGLIRGFRKSLRRFIALLIPTVLLFIFLTPLTNAVMKTKVDLAKIDNIVQVIPDEYTTETYSIDSAISLVIGSTIYPDDHALQENSDVQKLAYGASSMVVKIIVYFIGLIAVWILSIIIRIILRIIFGKAKRSGRLIGLGIGFGQFILNFIIFLLPLFGMLSFASSLIHDVSEYTKEEETMEMVVEYADLYEETITKKYLLNPATKILCTNKSLSCDAQFVVSAFSFKVNNEKVNLCDEYLEIKEALPSLVKLVNVVSELNSSEEKIVKLSTFTDEDIENISSILRNSHLMRASIPAILEYAVYSTKDQDNTTSVVLSKLKNVNWDQEINAIADLINVLKDHNDLEINVGNFESVIKSEGFIDLVEDLITGVFQIEVITDVAIPLAIDMLEEQFTSEEFSSYEIDFTKIKNINWKTDGSSFVSTVFAIYKEYLKLDINFTDLKVALNDEELPDFVTFTFDELQKSSIVTDTILPILMQVLIANLEKEESLTNLDIDFEALKTVVWKDSLDDIKVLLHDLIESYQVLDINPDEFALVLKNNKLQTELDKAVTNILNCEVFADYILPIAMNALINNLETNESLTSFDFDFVAIRNTNWKTELAAFKDVFIEFLNAYQGLDFNKDEWTLILDNPKLATYITNIYNKCKKSTLVSEHILPKLPNKLHELIDNMESSIDVSFLKDIITEETIDTLFTKDINKLIGLLKEIKGLGLFDKAELDFNNPTTQDALINVVKQLFDLSVIEGKEKDIFKSVINMINIESMLIDYNITLDYENVSNWDNEVDNICVLFKNVMSLTGGLEGFDFTEFFTKTHTEEDKQLIAEIVASVGNSDIFGDSIYTIIDTVAKEIDESCTINVTPEEKYIIESVNGWEYEALHILNLVEKIEHIDFEQHYENLDAQEIKDLMIYCSESLVSTKVFGTILNNTFGDVVHQDFTNPTVMKNSSDVVYNAIKVASIMNDPSFDLSDATSTDELISSIENIASSEENLELTNQLINDIIGNETPVEYTKEDISDAASVVEDIISVYQNSTDKDGFDITNLPEEEKEKIENSDIAKAILDALFK